MPHDRRSSATASSYSLKRRWTTRVWTRLRLRRAEHPSGRLASFAELAFKSIPRTAAPIIFVLRFLFSVFLQMPNSGAWAYALQRGGAGLAPQSLWIARDVRGRERTTKQFRQVASWTDYEVALFSPWQKHLYELIPDGFRTRVWFFADHDCKVSDARGMSADAFVREVCRAHYAHFDLGPEDLGKVMFVSETCRADKLSVHVKINLETTLAEAKAHAEAICRECGQDDRIKPDLSVYSGRNQQIRALGSSKLGTGVAKQPVPGCDDGNNSHHMVRVNPHHGMRVISRPCPEEPPSAKTARGETSRADAGADHVIREAIKHSLFVSGCTFGDDFDADVCHVEDVRTCEDGEKMICYVDGTSRFGGTLRCPFAGRSHKTNRACFVVVPNGGLRPGAPGTGEIVFKCMDDACRSDGKRLVVPYDLRPQSGEGDAARAILPAS